MGSLVFSRKFQFDQCLITGVKRPNELLFSKILGRDQLIASHPFTLQDRLKSGRGPRTPALKLDPLEFAVYVRDGQFEFRGRPLLTGKCLT